MVPDMVMDDSTLLEIYRAMLTARRIDEAEQEIVRRGEAFFHVSGAGHEGTAAIVPHLIESDWLLCHYRDKAVVVGRGYPVRGFFDGLLCNDASTCRGRPISAHSLHSPQLNLVSMAGPVANGCLHAVGIAAVIKSRPERPIVYCSIGDGTTQEGEFYEGCAEAARNGLPVLYLVEDNRWAISTRTSGKTFYRHERGEPAEFHGIPISRLDGRYPDQACARLGEIVMRMREDRWPHVVVLDVDRLSSHTNADDQRIYRAEAEIQRCAAIGDPLGNLAAVLRARGVTEPQLAAIAADVQQRVAEAERQAREARDPKPQHSARMPIRVEITHPARERTAGIVAGGSTMKDALRETLRHHLRTDARVWIWGQDIEDPKGDVFGVTRGLSTEFPERVCNAPLAEATIVGAAIGRALAGQRPIAFLQFADFLPIAFNQIFCELATMFWRSDGHWRVPVVVMAPCGGYRPGLGPFHSHSLESILAHVPGIDVMLPSTASDAAGMLNAALESERPTLFFYPKSLLNDPAQATAPEVAEQFVPIGVARKVRAGRDITLVGWGNTVRLCVRAAEALEKAGVGAEVIDLRSISPWDQRMVLASAEHTARLLVVHEDNITCGFGAEILAVVGELARVPVAVKRVARSDTLVPCNFANQLEVLPSFRTVMNAAAELLDMDLEWIEPPAAAEAGCSVVDAVGSGPSDESVTLTEWYVRLGDTVTRGQPLAALEATKSVFDLSSPFAGKVEKLHAEPGHVVPVGAPLVTMRTDSGPGRRKPIVQEKAGTPLLRPRRSGVTIHLPRREGQRRIFEVGVSPIATMAGGRVVTNQELLRDHHAMTADDILRRTGIEERRWIQNGESAVSLAAKACWQVLDQEQMLIDDLDLVICSTTSPNSVTPSMACQVLNALCDHRASAMLQAYDINAACSGYLYALQAGYDFLQSQPEGRVLIVTAEVLSPLLNPDDFDTAILFGDATSATILYGEEHIQRAKARLYRPELSGKAEDGSSLSVPLPHDGYIQMKGRKVFTEAVRAMVTSLNRACQRQGLAVDDLALIVPHQANQRIIDAIQNRVSVPVFSNIRHYGNTSSTSIPLCLAELLPAVPQGSRLGLCAFGGGFTFGASILQKNAG